MKLNQAKLHLHRITHLEGCANYTYVHFIDSPPLLHPRTLSYSLAHLPGLLRIHRKYAVNPHFIDVVKKDQATTWITINAKQLPISRRLTKPVLAELRLRGKPAESSGFEAGCQAERVYLPNRTKFII